MKSPTRMLRACCTELTDDGAPCGYTIRITRKWAVELGAVCPTHGAMVVDGVGV